MAGRVCAASLRAVRAGVQSSASHESMASWSNNSQRAAGSCTCLAVRGKLDGQSLAGDSADEGLLLLLVVPGDFTPGKQVPNNQVLATVLVSELLRFLYNLQPACCSALMYCRSASAAALPTVFPHSGARSPSKRLKQPLMNCITINNYHVLGMPQHRHAVDSRHK